MRKYEEKRLKENEGIRRGKIQGKRKKNEEKEGKMRK